MYARTITFLSAFASIVGHVRSSECYWPNGTSVTATTNSSYYPCSSLGDSACCLEDEVCLSNGLCVGATYGNFYRGACTDKSWTTSACPQLCTGEGDSVWPWANVYPCNAGIGGKWWCGGAGATICEDGENSTKFNWPQATVLGVVTNHSAAVTSSILMTSMDTATSSTSGPTAALSSNAAKNTAADDADLVSRSVPIGVGVGLGVPLAIASATFAALWLMERRKRIAAEKDYNALPRGPMSVDYGQPLTGGLGSPGMHGYGTHDPLLHHPLAVSEHAGLHQNFAEADDSRQIAELPGQKK